MAGGNPCASFSTLTSFTPSLQEKEKDTHIRNSRAVFRTFILEMLTIRCLSTNIKGNNRIVHVHRRKKWPLSSCLYSHTEQEEHGLDLTYFSNVMMKHQRRSNVETIKVTGLISTVILFHESVKLIHAFSLTTIYGSPLYLPCPLL